ncbi:MAG: class I SAM-dependent methyltransferase [Desulfobacter sp.]|nr:MAG: class I SAM-dependent methyltransferase [Desulfobacter sp.]
MDRTEESFWAQKACNYDRYKKNSIEKIVEQILKDIKPEDDVLDIACGTGLAALKVAECAKHVDAVDSETKMLSVAQQKIDSAKIQNIDLHVQNAYDLDFPDRHFDSIIILNSLHVMETPEAALKEAKRVLKPKGKLYVPTYCHAETEEVLKNYEKWSLKSGHTSYHLFTCQSLCDRVESCGFEIQENKTHYINTGMDNGIMAIGYVVATHEI